MQNIGTIFVIKNRESEIDPEGYVTIRRILSIICTSKIKRIRLILLQDSIKKKGKKERIKGDIIQIASKMKIA